MKTMKYKLVMVLLAAFSMQVSAQQDLLSAIVRLAESKKAKVAHSVSYSRPTSDLVAAQLGTAGSMKSMLETYSFEMKAKDAKLVDDIVQAMYAQKDNPDCYRIEGYNASSEKPRAWNLVYGEDATSGIEIGKNNVYNYTFVNIADKTTASQYRTCYCIEWREWMKKIDGRVIITYARIPDMIQKQMRPADVGSMDFSDLIVDTVTIDPIIYKALIKLNSDGFYELLKKGNIKSMEADEVLPLINALRTTLTEADWDEAYLIAPLLYKVIKDAVDQDLLTKDERDVVSQQLKRAITSAELPSKPYDQNAQATLDYLRLAVKVLEQPQPLP